MRIPLCALAFAALPGCFLYSPSSGAPADRTAIAPSSLHYEGDGTAPFVAYQYDGDLPAGGSWQGFIQIGSGHRLLRLEIAWNGGPFQLGQPYPVALTGGSQAGITARLTEWNADADLIVSSTGGKSVPVTFASSAVKAASTLTFVQIGDKQLSATLDIRFEGNTPDAQNPDLVSPKPATDRHIFTGPGDALLLSKPPAPL